MSELHTLVKKGKLEDVVDYLDKITDESKRQQVINELDPDIKLPAIHLAAMHGHDDIVKYLLKNNADVLLVPQVSTRSLLGILEGNKKADIASEVAAAVQRQVDILASNAVNDKEKLAQVLFHMFELVGYYRYNNDTENLYLTEAVKICVLAEEYLNKLKLFDDVQLWHEYQKNLATNYDALGYVIFLKDIKAEKYYLKAFELMKEIPEDRYNNFDLKNRSIISTDLAWMYYGVKRFEQALLFANDAYRFIMSYVPPKNRVDKAEKEDGAKKADQTKKQRAESYQIGLGRLAIAYQYLQDEFNKQGKYLSAVESGKKAVMLFKMWRNNCLDEVSLNANPDSSSHFYKCQVAINDSYQKLATNEFLVRFLSLISGKLKKVCSVEQLEEIIANQITTFSPEEVRIFSILSTEDIVNVILQRMPHVFLAASYLIDEIIKILLLVSEEQKRQLALYVTYYCDARECNGEKFFDESAKILNAIVEKKYSIEDVIRYFRAKSIIDRLWQYKVYKQDVLDHLESINNHIFFENTLPASQLTEVEYNAFVCNDEIDEDLKAEESNQRKGKDVLPYILDDESNKYNLSLLFYALIGGVRVLMHPVVMRFLGNNGFGKIRTNVQDQGLEKRQLVSVAIISAVVQDSFVFLEKLFDNGFAINCLGNNEKLAEFFCVHLTEFFLLKKLMFLGGVVPTLKANFFAKDQQGDRKKIFIMLQILEHLYKHTCGLSQQWMLEKKSERLLLKIDAVLDDEIDAKKSGVLLVKLNSIFTDNAVFEWDDKNQCFASKCSIEEMLQRKKGHEVKPKTDNAVSTEKQKPSKKTKKKNKQKDRLLLEQEDVASTDKPVIEAKGSKSEAIVPAKPVVTPVVTKPKASAVKQVTSQPKQPSTSLAKTNFPLFFAVTKKLATPTTVSAAPKKSVASTNVKNNSVAVGSPLPANAKNNFSAALKKASLPLSPNAKNNLGAAPKKLAELPPVGTSPKKQWSLKSHTVIIPTQSVQSLALEKPTKEEKPVQVLSVKEREEQGVHLLYPVFDEVIKRNKISQADRVFPNPIAPPKQNNIPVTPDEPVVTNLSLELMGFK